MTDLQQNACFNLYHIKPKKKKKGFPITSDLEWYLIYPSCRVNLRSNKCGKDSFENVGPSVRPNEPITTIWWLYLYPDTTWPNYPTSLYVILSRAPAFVRLFFFFLLTSLPRAVRYILTSTGSVDAVGFGYCENVLDFQICKFFLTNSMKCERYTS